METSAFLNTMPVFKENLILTTSLNDYIFCFKDLLMLLIIEYFFVKVGSWTFTFQKVDSVCFNQGPLNTFYFILKALYFLRYLSFCFDVCGNVGKRLDKKA